jgi:cold shock CspA family protein
MEKEFVTFDEALALKKLGFDEPCLAYYCDMRSFGREYPSAFSQTKDSPIMGTRNSQIEELIGYNICSTPTYQQIFKWFRDKKGLDAFIVKNNKSGEYFFDISWCNKKDKLKQFQSIDFKTHEKAELACLIKLIEKRKKKENGE